MSDNTQVDIHPIAALTVAERQITFDRNEKLLLSQDVFQLREIVAAQKAQIDELEARLNGKPAQ